MRKTMYRGDILDGDKLKQCGYLYSSLLVLVLPLLENTGHPSMRVDWIKEMGGMEHPGSAAIMPQ